MPLQRQVDISIDVQKRVTEIWHSAPAGRRQSTAQDHWRHGWLSRDGLLPGPAPLVYMHTAVRPSANGHAAPGYGQGEGGATGMGALLQRPLFQSGLADIFRQTMRTFPVSMSTRIADSHGRMMETCPAAAGGTEALSAKHWH